MPSKQLTPSESSGPVRRSRPLMLVLLISVSGFALVAALAARWSADEARKDSIDLRQQVTAYHQKVEVLERRIDEIEHRRTADATLGADRGAHAESVEAPSP